MADSGTIRTFSKTEAWYADNVHVRETKWFPRDWTNEKSANKKLLSELRKVHFDLAKRLSCSPRQCESHYKKLLFELIEDEHEDEGTTVVRVFLDYAKLGDHNEDFK